MTDLATLKKRLWRTPATHADYEAQAPEFAAARELVAARMRARLAQEQADHRKRAAPDGEKKHASN